MFMHIKLEMLFLSNVEMNTIHLNIRKEQNVQPFQLSG